MARNEEEGEHHPLCAAAMFAILACCHQQQVQAGLMQLVPTSHLLPVSPALLSDGRRMYTAATLLTLVEGL